MKHNYDFETEPHVCKNCGGDNWHYNTFFLNNKKQWFDGEIDYWCHDCGGEVSVVPLNDYVEEDEA